MCCGFICGNKGNFPHWGGVVEDGPVRVNMDDWAVWVEDSAEDSPEKVIHRDVMDDDIFNLVEDSPLIAFIGGGTSRQHRGTVHRVLDAQQSRDRDDVNNRKYSRL